MELSQEEMKMVLAHRERKAFNDAYNQAIRDCVTIARAEADRRSQSRDGLREVADMMQAIIRVG
jgi:hypothetical protein